MTEIPEHLLARSRARREAIGQSEGDAPTADAPAASAAVERASEAAPATATGPAGVAAATPAKAPAAPAPPPEKPKRPEVVAAESRKKIPWWAVPALAALPAWAVLYAGTLNPRGEQSAALTLGQQVYESNGCVGCHGPGGAGQAGVFPAFTAGEVALTFPDYNDQVAWIHSGSAGDAVGPDGGFGDPAREGGQHNVATFSGQMPGFPDLSEADVLAVARYEREVLGEVPCEPALAEATGEECAG